MMPDNPLPANYKWVPIAYHGRASSVRASGAAVRRPEGQRRPERDGEAPPFAGSPQELVDHLGALADEGIEVMALPWPVVPKSSLQ